MNRHATMRWLERNWLALLAAVLVVIPACGFILGSAFFLTYIYWPVPYSALAAPQINPATQQITLIAHGLGDSDASWTASLRDTLQQKADTGGEPRQVIALDWSAYSKSAVRCSVDGLRIGEKLGSEIAESAALHSLHLIGHSCGAFLVLGLCEALKARRHDILVQTTYLDPVSIYGGVFWNYGLEHFGSCADFSDAYIDTEDKVTGSNQLLPNSYTVDVTAARKRSGSAFAPHIWPVHYYSRLIESGYHPHIDENGAPWQCYPRGKMHKADTLPTAETGTCAGTI